MAAFSGIENRQSKISTFGNGYQRLTALLDGIAPEATSFRSRQDVWSINEMVIHLADLEAAAYLNFRVAVAEPTEGIVAFDKDLWAESLGYYSQPIDASLKLFRLLRASNYLLLKNIPQDAWLNTVNDPESGQITLEDLLDLYQNHFDRVMREIQNNADDWAKHS